MKSVKKIFKRKKGKDQREGSSVLSGSSALSAPSAPSSSRFEDTPESDQLRHASDPGFSANATMSPSQPTNITSDNTESAAALERSTNDSSDNQDRSLPMSLGSVSGDEEDGDEEQERPVESPLAKIKHKGVSESFKGMTPTQRFHVADTVATDPNQAASLGSAYDSIPLIEQVKLPRGGISMETQSVGRVQFGIPPETIKDSMRLGIPVPQVYIVPAERFCREMGPALGVNLAEFEFPAYFNFFVYKKKCTLVVDTQDAQDNIVRVFSETLLGPEQFIRKENPMAFEEEDFAPDFPRAAIPNFEKELRHFRKMPDGSELALESILDFCQFKQTNDTDGHQDLGVPPNFSGDSDDDEMLQELLEEELEGEEEDEENVPEDAEGVEKRESAKWSHAKARWVGDVATVWPVNATEEEKANRSVGRVEIFKMPSGTEYILHDIDVNNVIIGKARFSGHVKVSESMSVDGFGGHSIMDDINVENDAKRATEDAKSVDTSCSESESRIPRAPPTFHAPSFGVTVLGNSHGFDSSGSVSGYVLWINGRGVMIDPPPYSSATLEREGIRPRTIVGIILTHCHADHDAGAFQKVLTGSPVVVITTPTIYKSFIRKYAALASLSPALLRHSHRHKPAMIGQPLRFQGATFHFFYSLHTIPCVGFRVEWRGRSMVFTGDHFNDPPAIDKLQESGVLSKARADDLRNIPLQDTDLLLHEAGAPPIHTPLSVLLKLPPKIKKRLYVVHTSNLPEDCELRVAPTGTAGTIRLDQLQRENKTNPWIQSNARRPIKGGGREYSISLEDDEVLPSPWSSASNEYGAIDEENEDEGDGDVPTRNLGQLGMHTSFVARDVPSKKKTHTRTSLVTGGSMQIPLVSLRPASSTDAWFILNLLSAVPFLSSLSYSSTMEVLETARVDAYCEGDVVVAAERRRHVLCVVWEGTCVERSVTSAQDSGDLSEGSMNYHTGAVWHAGDWTGPIVLQPEKRLSGESDLSANHDIVAMSSEGVKVITVEFASLHGILKSGSVLYRKYLERRSQQKRRLSAEVASHSSKDSSITHKLLTEALKNLNVLELLDQNSAMRKLSAIQKRHLESLAEGPIGFGPGERLWRSGAPVDKAFIIVSGTASFAPRRRNAGSASIPSSGKGLNANTKLLLSRLGESTASIGSESGDSMQNDIYKAVEEMGDVSSDFQPGGNDEDHVHIQMDSLFSRSGNIDGQQARSLTETHDFAKLSRNLQKRADLLCGETDVSVTSSQDASEDSENRTQDLGEDNGSVGSLDRRANLKRRRSSRARFANKVLGRLYSRRAYTSGLVFSRGHFLGDVSKMVAGLLSPDLQGDDLPRYGFGDRHEGSHDGSLTENLTDMVIHEQEDDNNNIVHSSTLTAGKDGCVVLVFPKSSLIPFLDEYPGLLLSLLGTQVVV